MSVYRTISPLVFNKYPQLVRLMTSISKGKNTPIVLKDKFSLK